MAIRVDDRYLWLGFGVCLVLASRAIRYALRDVAHLTEITTSDKNARKQGERAEDSLSLENLKALALSPNPSVSGAAVSVVIARLSHQPHVKQTLLADSTSEDLRTRTLARQAIAFLDRWSMGAGVKTSAFPPPGFASDDYSETGSIFSPEPLHLRGFEPAMFDDEEWTVGAFGAEPVVIPSLENPVAGWTNIPRERPLPGDEREMDIRRRRREAMVLHEGAGNVDEDDIIRPRRYTPSELSSNRHQ